MEGRSLKPVNGQRFDLRLIPYLIVGGYALLLYLAHKVDERVYKHRLRKKRAQQGTPPNDRPRFGKDDPRGPKKR